MKTILDIRKKLVRAIRGKKSQQQINRKLKVHDNRAHRWESGQVSPSWLDFVRLVKAANLDLSLALRKTFGFEGDPASYPDLIRWIAGSDEATEIAHRTGLSRFAIYRALTRKSCPSLDTILTLLDEVQFTLPEFIGYLLPHGHLDEYGLHFPENGLKKELLYRYPLAEAALAFMSLDTYQRIRAHPKGWLAARLGVSQEEEAILLIHMLQAGLIRREGERFLACTQTVDTQGNAKGTARLQSFWLDWAASVISQSTTAPRFGRSGYFVFKVSKKAESKLFDAYYEFMLKVRAILKTDKDPAETVKLLGLQILDFKESSDVLSSGKGSGMAKAADLNALSDRAARAKRAKPTRKQFRSIAVEAVSARADL